LHFPVVFVKIQSSPSFSEDKTMSQKFTKEMTFHQALQASPEVARILGSFNLGCVGCMGAANETLAQGATAHGLDVEELLTALNAISAD
jgi:hybrid cluster-associated redox disulfide protein